jgi:UDP-N-acetylglucosamine 4,6-dehydratase
MFKNKILVITGGTGSFGNATISKFLASDIKEIRIFSRDEKKQDDIRKHYNNNKLKFYLGDVRDSKSLKKVFVDANFCFHAAALKQVPSCEFHPIEAVKTNILGTENVINACISNGLEKVICLSTDKAVYPINAMGISKAMMEKIMIASSRNYLKGKTIIAATRYGNVLASRGSVLPLFINQILAGKRITLTDPNMTRFIMTLSDAIDLVMHAFRYANSGDIFIKKSDSCTIENLAYVVLDLMNKTKQDLEIIGTRHGEKLYETLLSREEASRVVDEGSFFRVPMDIRSLDYEPFINQGDVNLSISKEYNSHNANLLSLQDLKNVILSIPSIEDILKGNFKFMDF